MGGGPLEPDDLFNSSCFYNHPSLLIFHSFSTYFLSSSLSYTHTHKINYLCLHDLGVFLTENPISWLFLRTDWIILHTRSPLWALADGELLKQWSQMFRSSKGHVSCLMDIWFLIMDLWQTPIIWILITMIYSELSLVALEVDIPESPCWVKDMESCLALRH